MQLSKAVQYLPLICVFFTFQAVAQFNYEWGIVLTDENTQRVTSMGLDNEDNVYVTGLYLISLDLEPGPGITELNSSFLNGFLAKYSKDGALLWATNLDMGTDATSPNQLPDSDVDLAGNSYVIGQQEYQDSTNIYFAKYDNNGIKVWDYEIPGGGFNGGRTVQALEDGSCIIAGFFSGTKDFDPSPEIVALTSDATIDLFIAKYKPDGTLDWAINFGGPNDNNSLNAGINDITTDLEGAIYIVGGAEDIFDFDPNNPNTNSTLTGAYTGYVAKFNASGEFVWVNQWDGGGESAVPHEITTDNTNNFIVTGIYEDTIDLNFSLDTEIMSGEGVHNIFVAKYTSDGTLAWGIPLRSSSVSSGTSICTDPMNNIHVTGFFGGQEGIDLDPSLNDSIFPNVGVYDMFYAQYDQTGNFINGFTIGGAENVETGIGVEVDNQNKIIIGGWYSSNNVDFDITAGIDSYSSMGTDIFVVKYDLERVTTSSSEPAKDPIQIFPNPVQNKQFLSLNIPDSSNYNIVLTNAQGIALGIFTNTNRIPCPKDPGIYYVTITNGNAQATSIPFIVVE